MIIRKCDNCKDECEPPSDWAVYEDTILHPGEIHVLVTASIRATSDGKSGTGLLDLCSECQRDAIRQAIGDCALGKVRAAHPAPGREEPSDG